MQATWRKKVTHTTEYLLPAGACIGELHKAIEFAWAQFCDVTGTHPDGSRWDNWATVAFDDEHVIIRVVTHEDAE